MTEPRGRLSNTQASQWEMIDKQRARTGGWWENMKTLRLRIYRKNVDPDEVCVFELNIHGDRVHGVRLAVSGKYDETAGVPAVFFTLQDFMHFLEVVEEKKGFPVPVELGLSWEVWDSEQGGSNGAWCGPYWGYQRALAIITEKFTP